MKKILLTLSFLPLSITTIILSLFLLSIQLSEKANLPHLSSQDSIEEAFSSLPNTSDQLSERVSAVRQFLIRHNSPLEEYSSYIVEVSETYGIDYRLIPAIAMQESNLCKKAPTDSYNCWGYGIYGGKVTYFSNYKEGIERIAFTLSQSYVRKGYSTIEQIMSRYTPKNTNNWVFAVSHFMSQME